MRTIKFEKMGLQTLFDYVASAHGNRRTIPGFHLKQFLNIARGGKSDAAAGIPDTCLVSPQSVPGISKDFRKSRGDAAGGTRGKKRSCYYPSQQNQRNRRERVRK